MIEAITMQDMDELRKIANEELNKTEKNEETTSDSNLPNAIKDSDDLITKPINDVTLNDIKIKLSSEKNYSEQALDIIDAMATASAVKDEKTAQALTEKKSKELRAIADSKLKQAKTNTINAETDKQEAKRKQHESVLSTFGIKSQLPAYLRIILLILLTVPYIIFTLIIGLPCGVLKLLIDNIDNVIVRYETVDVKNKPKIKVTVWILFILAALAGIAFVLLKIFNKI